MSLACTSRGFDSVSFFTSFLVVLLDSCAVLHNYNMSFFRHMQLPIYYKRRYKGSCINEA